MNKLYFYTTLFNVVRNHRFVPPQLFGFLRRFVKKQANKELPKYLASAKKEENVRCEDIIVSVTSFPGRIDTVWMTIQTLKLQTVLPEKIILWLSNQQFKSEKDIPISLRNLVDDLFEIRMVDEDIRSHKKYFYALKEYPNKSIVTFDDDIFYHPDTLKCLLDANKIFPHAIIANRTVTLKTKNGDILPYSKWYRRTKPFDNCNQVQIGVGGVLYPIGSLHEEVLNKDIFMKVTPMADDLWLNAMARLQGSRVIRSQYRGSFLGISDGSPTLSSANYNGGQNDIQLIQLRDYINLKFEIDIYLHKQ